MPEAAIFQGLSWNPITDLHELVSYPFMVHALEAGTIVAVMAGVTGWFMVLRQQTFAGHTLSIIAFPGAAAASLAGLPLAVGYFGFCGVGALALAGIAGTRTSLSAESAAIGSLQALAKRPEMLLLDEPLDSLDLPNQASVAALVARICREEAVTVIIVAHDVNPLLGYLDRVVYLGAGGAMSGPPEQVITSDALSRLYAAPIEVLRTSDGQLVVVGQPEAPAHHSDRHA